MTLRAAIMQPYLFPYIGYFQLCAAVDRFVALDDADWKAGGWINRNRLMTGSTPYWFTLPASGPRFGNPIHAVEPDRRRYRHWRAKMLRGLDFDYAAAPNRAAIVALVADVLPAELPDGTSIADLALASIAAVFEHVGLPFAALRSSTMPLPGPELRGVDRVIAICRHLGADAYLNSPGGRALYDEATFAAAGLSLDFVDSGEAARRVSAAPDGTPLSILHVLMHHDADAMRRLIADVHLA